MGEFMAGKSLRQKMLFYAMIYPFLALTIVVMAADSVITTYQSGIRRLRRRKKIF